MAYHRCSRACATRFPGCATSSPTAPTPVTSTLYHAGSGVPVARLRPTGQDDRVEVLYWSLWKEPWVNVGPFGRTVMTIDRALQFIASEDIFCAAG